MQSQILGMLTPMMALLFSVTFALFWKLGLVRRHVLGFSLGYLTFAIGFLVTHFLPPNAPYLFHTTQFFYAIGSMLFIGSLCERVGQRVHIPTLVGIYLISAIALAVAVYFTPNVGPRLIIVNTGYGTTFVFGLSILLMAPRKSLADYAMIAIVAMQAADFLVRPNLSLMIEQSIPAGEYRESIYYSLIGLVLGVKSVIVAMVLIAATFADWTETLRQTSEKDPLSGLHNRAAFEDVMRTTIPKAQMEGRAFSLVVADIDHFKQVNDIWGHQSGDRAITSFGKLIGDMIRGCDTAGRVGGEEFCIAVWNCPNEPAERLAERIRQAFAQLQHEGLNDDIRLTASFGVATAQDDEDYERLFARADAALYEAKTGGRNRVENADRKTVPSMINKELEAVKTPEQIPELATNEKSAAIR